MLVIRSEQMQALGAAQLDRFKHDLRRQLAAFAPELHALRGDEVFRAVVDDGVARAQGHGFSNRGPLRFFVECMLAYGTGFDSDVQIPGLHEVLVRRHANGQAWHADQAFAAIERYRIATRGPDNVHAVAALGRVAPFMERIDALHDDRLEHDLLDLMARIHPEKSEFVGRARLEQLIAQSREEASRHRIDGAAGVALLCGLMFALGHGVARDPLYPWVGATLRPSPARGAARRIESLRRKTRRYLAATLHRLSDR